MDLRSKNLNNVVWRGRTLPDSVQAGVVSKILVPWDLLGLWAKLETDFKLESGILHAICVWENRGFDAYHQTNNGLGIFQLENIAIEQVRRDTAGIVYDRTKPIQASYAAAILLSRYTKQFKTLPLVIMAWNWGETNARKWIKIKQSGVEPELNKITAEYIYYTGRMLA
jgi:Transglycosylase SLT domain